jgi:hypothetical protein
VHKRGYTPIPRVGLEPEVQVFERLISRGHCDQLIRPKSYIYKKGFFNNFVLNTSHDLNTEDGLRERDGEKKSTEEKH